MIFNDYQSKIRKYVDYPVELGPFYVIMDVMKNIGNISDILKKSVLDEGNFTEENIKLIKKNLGNVLNDISNMATDLNISLDDIAQDNIHYLEIINKNKED